MARHHDGVHLTCGSLRHASRKHFSGFEFFLLPSRIHARPHAGNANRWAAKRTQVLVDMNKKTDVKLYCVWDESLSVS